MRYFLCTHGGPGIQVQVVDVVDGEDPLHTLVEGHGQVQVGLDVVSHIAHIVLKGRREVGWKLKYFFLNGL